MVSHKSLPNCYLYLSGDSDLLIGVGLFDFESTYAIFTRVKSHFLGSFWYKTMFAQRSSMTAYEQSDVEFYGESYGAQDVTRVSLVPKFYMKNLEKVEKIMNIQEYPTKFLHFSALLNL